MIDGGFVKRLKGLTLGALSVFLLLTLLSGQVSAADEATVEVGITPNPLAVSVFAPSEVIEGKQFEVTAQIQNLGGGDIESTVATIHLDETGLSLVGKQEAEKKIGKIKPNKVKTVDWRVKAVEADNYIIIVSVSGRGATGDLTVQDSIMVTVIERPRRFLDLFQRWYQLFIGG